MMKALDLLLQQCSRRPVPPLSSQFEQRVWRAIRQRESVADTGWGGWLEAWVSLFWQPRFAVSTLALVLGIGMGVAHWDAGVGDGAQPRYAMAQQSLHLDAFSGRAPSLPSTLMAHHP